MIKIEIIINEEPTGEAIGRVDKAMNGGSEFKTVAELLEAICPSNPDLRIVEYSDEQIKNEGIVEENILKVSIEQV